MSGGDGLSPQERVQALLGTQVNQKTGRARRISPVRALRADHAVSRNLSPQERVERLLHTESAGNQAGKASTTRPQSPTRRKFRQAGVSESQPRIDPQTESDDGTISTLSHSIDGVVGGVDSGVDYYLTERRPFSHSTTPRSIQMNTKAQPGVDKSQETDSDMEIFHAKLNNLGRSYSKNNHVSANAYKVSLGDHRNDVAAPQAPEATAPRSSGREIVPEVQIKPTRVVARPLQQKNQPRLAAPRLVANRAPPKQISPEPVSQGQTEVSLKAPRIVSKVHAQQSSRTTNDVEVMLEPCEPEPSSLLIGRLAAGTPPTKPDAEIRTPDSSTRSTEAIVIQSQAYPTVLDDADPSVGGCDVDLFNDDLFAAVRALFRARADFLDSFSFGYLGHAGGKGGDMLGFTEDATYIVKSVNSVDHQTLLNITEHYVDHMCSGESLICPILMHFRRRKERDCFMVMKNCLPSDEGIRWDTKYDLKGNRDDKIMEDETGRVEAVHKRCWNVNMFSKCCWTVARHKYYDGKMAASGCKFEVPAATRLSVMSRLTYDVKFLQTHGLMDYSLYVGVQTGKRSTLVPGVYSEQPMLSKKDTNGNVTAYYMGIIDILQTWTKTKKIARLVKTCAPKPKSTVPPGIYARQFLRHFDNAFTTVQP